MKKISKEKTKSETTTMVSFRADEETMVRLSRLEAAQIDVVKKRRRSIVIRQAIRELDQRQQSMSEDAKK